MIVLTIGYMILILATSLIPMDRDISGLRFIIGLKPVIQNFLHIPVFAVLAIFLLRVLRDIYLEGGKRVMLVLTLCVGFGLINELIQIAIPGRYPGLLDMIFDTIGVLAGIVLYVSLERSKPGLVRHIICK